MPLNEDNKPAQDEGHCVRRALVQTGRCGATLGLSIIPADLKPFAFQAKKSPTGIGKGPGETREESSS